MKTVLFAIFAFAFSINASAAELAHVTTKAVVKDDKAAILSLYNSEIKKPNSPLRLAIDKLASEAGIPNDGNLSSPAKENIMEIGSSQVNSDYYVTYLMGVPAQWNGTARERIFLTAIRVTLASEHETDSKERVTTTTTITLEAFGDIVWK